MNEIGYSKERVILLIEISFTKQEITELLNINPNEKNIRIINYMNNIFKINDNFDCYSKGRGKNIEFKALIEANSKDYLNLKLWLMNRYNFKTNYNYNLCLKLIYFLMNNNSLLTLEEIANPIGENISNVKKYRNIMLNDLFTRQDLSRQQVYSDKEEIVDIDLYDSIQRTFKNTFKKICNSNQKNDYLEVYYLDKEEESNYQVVGVNDNNYEDIVYSLEIKGYELVEKGYLYTNNKINEYLKNKLYQLHLNLYGYEYLYIKSIYTLSQQFINDNEFKEKVTNAIEYYNKNLK